MAVYNTIKSSLPFPYNLSAAAPFSAFNGPNYSVTGEAMAQKQSSVLQKKNMSDSANMPSVFDVLHLSHFYVSTR